jgi:uncharacterized protein YbjT (DUF2867 family)
MAILLTGGTGVIGAQVLAHLQDRDVNVRVLTRSPDTARLPAGVTPVHGELADVESMRAALSGVSTLFLLAPNVADELTQVMLSLEVARQAGVKGIVYLSVFNGKAYADVPHFVAKHTAERMIAALGLPATILQPSYFMQNDLRMKDPLLQFGAYGSPIGSKGIAMIDTRDVGEAAAIELARRERAEAPLGAETYALLGPDTLTGDAVAAVWSEVLGRAIQYGGDDLDGLEQRLKAAMPAWHALDLRLMFSRYQTDGALARSEHIARLTRLLGHPPRSYRAFATEAAAQWKAA